MDYATVFVTQDWVVYGALIVHTFIINQHFFLSAGDEIVHNPLNKRYTFIALHETKHHVTTLHTHSYSQCECMCKDCFVMMINFENKAGLKLAELFP